MHPISRKDTLLRCAFTFLVYRFCPFANVFCNAYVLPYISTSSHFFKSKKLHSYTKQSLHGMALFTSVWDRHGFIFIPASVYMEICTYLTRQAKILDCIHCFVILLDLIEIKRWLLRILCIQMWCLFPVYFFSILPYQDVLFLHLVKSSQVC